MGEEVAFAAVVPLAFFTRDNVDMTDSFLRALAHEPGLVDLRVYLNGGAEPWREQGESVARVGAMECVDALGWPFYEMWNRGILASDLPTLVLNNDISWPRGDLQKLARALDEAPRDVAVTYPRFEPDSRGLAGWCFAIRPEAFADAGAIDRRYITWFGDDEMVLQLKRAGYRTLALDVEVWHKVTQTMVHRPGYFDDRFSDMALFDSKWEGEVSAWLATSLR